MRSTMSIRHGYLWYRIHTVRATMVLISCHMVKPTWNFRTFVVLVLLSILVKTTMTASTAAVGTRLRTTPASAAGRAGNFIPFAAAVAVAVVTVGRTFLEFSICHTTFVLLHLLFLLLSSVKAAMKIRIINTVTIITRQELVCIAVEIKPVIVIIRVPFHRTDRSR